MYLVKKSQTNRLKTTNATTILEYLMEEDGVSGAVAKIHGNYPEKGFAVNEVCKELVYILRGSGQIVTESEQRAFETGDVIFINRRERFRWEGDFSMFMVTTPKFDPNQHKII